MLMRGHTEGAFCEICNERQGIRTVHAIGMEAWACGPCSGDDVEALPVQSATRPTRTTESRRMRTGRAIGKRVAEFDELEDAMHYSRIHGREYSVIGGIDKPWAVGKWVTLEDDDIRAVVNPPPPGDHAIRNAAQAAMLVESDREAM